MGCFIALKRKKALQGRSFFVGMIEVSPLIIPEVWHRGKDNTIHLPRFYLFFAIVIYIHAVL